MSAANEGQGQVGVGDQTAGTAGPPVASVATGKRRSRPRPSGIWSYQTLRERLPAANIIQDEKGNPAFAEDQLDPAGYLLRMGNQVYVSPAKAEKRESIRDLKQGEAFRIPPGQFAFLLTEEVVLIPSDLFAFISLRSKSKFRGLVNVSGFHADPGFHGKLIFAVFNAGPGDVHLRRGERLFMITLASLDQTTAKPRSDREMQLSIPSDLIAPIAGEVQSLAGLKENIDSVEDDLDGRLHALEREVAITRWALALLLGGLVTLLVRSMVG